MEIPEGLTMPKPTQCNLTKKCPHCGEAVEITITKAHLEELLKVFEMDLTDAQLKAEKIGKQEPHTLDMSRLWT